MLQGYAKTDTLVIITSMSRTADSANAAAAETSVFMVRLPDFRSVHCCHGVAGRIKLKVRGFDAPAG